MRRQLAWAFALHYAAYVIMQTLALYAETRRGPAMPDLLHDLIAPQRQLDFLNSTFWLVSLIVSITFLAFAHRAACINYLRVGAIVSLSRGMCIILTSLGPPQAVASSTPEAMKSLQATQISWQLLLQQWLPIDVLWGGAGRSAAYLTQDLFFSGHTASTFLFLLVIDRRQKVGIWFFAFHSITVIALVLTHEHYTIDIIGAYFATYAIYRFMEQRGWLLKTE